MEKRRTVRFAFFCSVNAGHEQALQTTLAEITANRHHRGINKYKNTQSHALGHFS